MIEQLYKTLLDKVNQGNSCVMLTYLNLHSDRNGSIDEKILLTKDELSTIFKESSPILVSEECCVKNNTLALVKSHSKVATQNEFVQYLNDKSLPLNKYIYSEIKLTLDTGKLRTVNVDENQIVVIEPIIPSPRLIVFGGGHIAKPLSELAARVGFAVTVIDDRPSFANTGRFPEAERVICEIFEKSFDLINLRPTDYVVVITRGHRHDGVVLREVLKRDLTYVGMIGSKRRVKAMMDELMQEGYTKDKLHEVNSPIGIEIGAITPDEIAISIVAQLINCKNKGLKSKTGESFTLPEFDREVVEEIIKPCDVPKALITIISSKGSVPRKAGAKMVVCFDGRTFGSIGGGCSESKVLIKAREVMMNKGFLIEHVDMTGEVAEDEGMVCGGVMEVLVEGF